MKIKNIIQKEYIKNVIKQIEPVVNGYKKIAAVYLLGSAQKGLLRDDSDIDIALLLNDKAEISMLNRLNLAAVFEEKLGRTVDVGIISSKNLIYSSEAILTGQRILTLREDYTKAMETRLLGCYIVFKQDRKEVENSYCAA